MTKQLANLWHHQVFCPRPFNHCRPHEQQRS